MTNRAWDLLGAYALGAVDASEQRLVERATSRDPLLRAELDGLLLTVDALDDIATEGVRLPGSGLWKRIETSTADVSRGGSAAGAGRPKSAPKSSRLGNLSWLVPLGAAASIALAVLTGWIVQLDANNAELEAALGAPLTAAVDQALADPGSSLVTLASPSGSSSTITVDVVHQPDGTGFVLGGSLPTLAADRTYQLWAIVGDRVISAGILGSDPAISPFRVAGELAGLAITEETSGGVVSSDNDPVAVWLASA